MPFQSWSGFYFALYHSEVGNLSLFICGYSSVLKRDLLIIAFSRHGFSFFLCVCEWNQRFNKATKKVHVKCSVAALDLQTQNANLLLFALGRKALSLLWMSWIRAVSHLICQCSKSCVKSRNLAWFFTSYILREWTVEVTSARDISMIKHVYKLLYCLCGLQEINE